MNINLNVKIKAGKRTPVEVSVYSTSREEKILVLTNGKKVGEKQIVNWLVTELTKTLEKLQNS
jgi:hypothetical protein